MLKAFCLFFLVMQEAIDNKLYEINIQVLEKGLVRVAALGAKQCVVMMYRQMLQQPPFASSFCRLTSKQRCLPECIQMCSAFSPPLPVRRTVWTFSNTSNTLQVCALPTYLEQNFLKLCPSPLFHGARRGLPIEVVHPQTCPATLLKTSNLPHIPRQPGTQTRLITFREAFRWRGSGGRAVAACLRRPWGRQAAGACLGPRVPWPLRPAALPSQSRALPPRFRTAPGPVRSLDPTPARPVAALVRPWLHWKGRVTFPNPSLTPLEQPLPSQTGAWAGQCLQAPSPSDGGRSLQLTRATHAQRVSSSAVLSLSDRFVLFQEVRSQISVFPNAAEPRTGVLPCNRSCFLVCCVCVCSLFLGEPVGK